MSHMRSISVARIALVVITLGSACSGAPDEDRTFVNRSSTEKELACADDRTLCRFTTSALTFRDVDGEVATGGASEGSFEPEFQLPFDAECGGVIKAWPGEPVRWNNFEMIEPLQIILADGSSLQLVPEVAISIEGACYDERGRWEGVGSLHGRSGTYRWLNDTLQIELNLSGL